MLRFGSRTVLLFEGETPVGDTPLSCHARELARVLCDHAEREYLPVAAQELTQLSSAGRGYDFTPHRLRFCAKAHLARGRMVLELSLRYTAGKRVLFAQNARQIWCADGSYRLR